MIFTSLAAANIQKNSTSEDGKPVVRKGPFFFLAAIFLLDITLFVWALTLAFRCGKRHEDRFIHVVFAFFSPLIYILYYFISGCGTFDGCGC